MSVGKAACTKGDSLSLIPMTHTMEGENQFLCFQHLRDCSPVQEGEGTSGVSCREEGSSCSTALRETPRSSSHVFRSLLLHPHSLELVMSETQAQKALET